MSSSRDESMTSLLLLMGCAVAHNPTLNRTPTANSAVGAG